MSQISRQEQSSNQADARRLLLIEATINAISTHGLSNITLAKIAGLVGLTAATVNFYFDSKQSLLLATLRHVAEEFESAVASVIVSAQEPSERLSALVEASLSEDLMSFDKVAVWYAFMSEASSRADYQAICGERDRLYADLIEKECIRLVDESGRVGDINASAISRAICGLIDDVWQDLLFDGDSFDREAQRDQCYAFLASIFPSSFTMPDSTFDHDLEQSDQFSYTLPGWIYQSDLFFDLEQDKLFLSAWQLVCHESDLKGPGSYMTYQLLQQRAFVIRSSGGDLRAFHNVCRHRAHLLVKGDMGQTPNQRIICPYHGWTYDLSGKRVAMGHPSSFPDHDASQFSLREIDCEVYRGFVFIRFKSQGASVAERMSPVDAEFSQYEPENLSHDESADWIKGVWTETVAIDWKNGVENFLEDYHFFMGHPQLAGLMRDEYEREAFDTDMSRLSHQLRDDPGAGWSARAYSHLLPEQKHLPESMRRRWTYYALYPNTFFDIYPEYMDFFQIIPIAPGRSLLRGRSYSLQANQESRLLNAVKYLNTRINHRVQREDNELTASVQQGLASGSFERGILSDKEVLLKHFGDYIRRKVPEANSLSPPTRAPIIRSEKENQ